MALLDEVKATMYRGPACTVGEFIEADPDGLGDELVEALADPTVYATAICSALAARGHKIGATAMQRHRRGDCTCESR